MFASVIIFSIAALLKKGHKKWQPSERYAGSALEIRINRRRCAGAIKRSTSFPICLYTIDHVRECTLKIARDAVHSAAKLAHFHLQPYAT
jgi:hypothetical protein